jgi:hypothetical protein
MPYDRTDLELSGVSFPPGSDRAVAVAVRWIGEAADVVRTVNGDAVNLARPGFRKRALSISCSDLRGAATDHLVPGSYVEAIAPEPRAITLTPAATAASIPAAVDVFGFTPDGRQIQPTAQPADPRPLQTVRDSARVASLRAVAPVAFAEPVASVHYRPVLPCLVMSSTNSDIEMDARSSWTLELEEV